MSVMVKNKTNKNYKRSQRGRSMVEMLGVLAIVGVLSVGGVYGYGVAMKKHKANELLHQASMLATTISAQAMTNDGKLPETITSFGNSSYGTFSTSATDTLGGKGFTITIENVDSAVCDQLKEGGMVQKVECNETAKTATLTYYKNLATTEAEGEKSPTGGSSDPCDNVKCGEGEQCISGACFKTNACTENCELCSYDDLYGLICEDRIGCTINSDCDDWCEMNGDGEKCFCNLRGGPAFTDEDGFISECQETSGVCEIAATDQVNKGGYKAAGGFMDWWSAVNFCKAHNASLVSLADLGITGGYQDDGECGLKEGDNCTGTVNWSDLEKICDYGAFWTRDVEIRSGSYNCPSGNYNPSYVYMVYPTYQEVSTGGFGNSGGGAYVLCK